MVLRCFLFKINIQWLGHVRAKGTSKAKKKEPANGFVLHIMQQCICCGSYATRVCLQMSKILNKALNETNPSKTIVASIVS